LAYNVVFKKSVHRDLKKLSKAEVSHILDQTEQELTKNPVSCPLLKGQFAGLRRYRIGDHRVIYALVGTEILVLRIGHRRDVYKGEMA
jgi:addiction module RelE/StbE family toxin